MEKKNYEVEQKIIHPICAACVLLVEMRFRCSNQSLQRHLQNKQFIKMSLVKFVRLKNHLQMDGS